MGAVLQYILSTLKTVIKKRTHTYWGGIPSLNISKIVECELVQPHKLISVQTWGKNASSISVLA